MLAQRYPAAGYDDLRSSPVRGAKSRPSKPTKSASTDSYARKSIKVNAVSKASLVMLDPRHAMGIDVGLEWHEEPSGAYDEFDEERFVPSSSNSSAGRRYAAAKAHDDMGSPTPELEAFTTSMDELSVSAVSYDGRMDRSNSENSVFEDDRDRGAKLGSTSNINSMTATVIGSTPPRGRPTRLDIELPTRTGKSAKSAKGNGTSLVRFFTWKKKDKQHVYPSPVDCRSASDLFEHGMPQSAPPTTTMFDLQHHAPLIQTRSFSEDDQSFSLPCSPEYHEAGLPIEAYGAYGSLQDGNGTPSCLPLREVRAAATVEKKSAYGGREPSRFAREQPIPALPPLSVNLSNSSPMMPDLFHRWGLCSPEQEARSPSLPSRGNTAGRNVSSVGRGVPGRDRKFTIILKSEVEVRRELMSRAPPLPTTNHGTRRPPAAGRHAGGGGGYAKRTSIAKHVIEGLLIENHGREEPTLPSHSTSEASLGVRTNRRRSRSVETRAPPLLAHFGFASTAIPEAETDDVPMVEMPFFPCSFQQAPAQRRQQSVRPVAAGSKPTSASPTVRPPRRTLASPARQAQPSIANTAANSTSAAATAEVSGDETHQARRVNLSNQRARAVAVASPSLMPRSPRMVLPLPVVNIMPPTPEPEADGISASAAAEEADRRITKAVESVTAASVIPPIVEAALAPAAPVFVRAGSPNSLCSPRSVYEEGRFSCAYGGIDSASSATAASAFDKDETDEMEYVTGLISTRRERTYSMSSDVSSSGSSTSGAFGFSDSLSSSSLVSGGSFSSMSSLHSQGLERNFAAITVVKSAGSNVSSLPEIVISSTGSMQSLLSAGTADDEAESETEGIASGAPSSQVQLRTLFLPQTGRKSPCDESDDCETPTLTSCRQMSSSSQTCASNLQQAGGGESKRLDLDMDLSDLAQELGLGRLSCILTPSSAAIDMSNKQQKKKASPPKPPKSQARNISQWRRSITSEAYDAMSSAHYTSTSPLSFSASAVQASLTPPRTPFGQTTAGKASGGIAGNVPTAAGGMGLGLDFGTTELSAFHGVACQHGQVEAAEEDEWSVGFAL